jgi:hypothetical protein
MNQEADMARRKKRNERTPQENRIITNKIARLQREGLSTDQATAAAFRMFRAGELQTATKAGQSTTFAGALKLAGLVGAVRARRRAQRRRAAKKK